MKVGFRHLCDGSTLTRTGTGNDTASISTSRDFIVLRDSTLVHRMTFRDGVPFEHVRDVLCDVPAADPDAFVRFKSYIWFLY